MVVVEEVGWEEGKGFVRRRAATDGGSLPQPASQPPSRFTCGSGGGGGGGEENTEREEEPSVPPSLSVAVLSMWRGGGGMAPASSVPLSSVCEFTSCLFSLSLSAKVSFPLPLPSSSLSHTLSPFPFAILAEGESGEGALTPFASVGKEMARAKHLQKRLR